MRPTISVPNNTNNDSENNIVKETERAKPIVFEPFEKWNSYRIKSTDIEIKYPYELFISTDNNKIIFDYLDPEDPEQKKEYSPLAEMRISLEKGSMDELIAKRKSQDPINLKQKEIALNNIAAQQLVYTSGLDGGTMYETYIPQNNTTVVIWYAGDSQLGIIFAEMLSTAKYSK